MKKRNIIYLGLFFYFVIPHKMPAWSEDIHKLITQSAILNSVLSKHKFLNKMNFERGIYFEMFKKENETKNVIEWVKYGSEVEDNSKYGVPIVFPRSNNHFHNPLLSWTEAGLDDWVVYQLSGFSAILWAQRDNLQEGYPEGINTWDVVRVKYYAGLTEVDLIERQKYFAETFKGLGHQVHLLEDMSVPEHVRNDAHVLNAISSPPLPPLDKWPDLLTFRCIEGWAKNNIAVIQTFVDPSKTNILYPNINLNTEGPTPSLLPFSYLYDTDSFNPGDIPSAGLELGLSEYTNANFVSEDTVFSSEDPDIPSWHQFPYPKKASTDLQKYIDEGKVPESYIAEDGKTDFVKYIAKIAHGDLCNHFLAIGYFGDMLVNNQQLNKTMFIDNLCHKDYASMLVPRAVGYSAALINYFFRGELEIALPEDDGIYGFAPYPDEGFKKITLMVKNITPEENMANGTFNLVVRYRNFSTGGEFDGLTPPQPEIEQKYILSKSLSDISLASGGQMKVTFELPTPLPVNVADVTLTVVFKGDLGAELSNAVAIGYKDISEPTAIEIFNDTGMVCFNENTVEYTNPDLIYYADRNHDGVITKASDVDIIPRTIRLGDILFKKDVSVDKAANTYFNFINNTNIEIDPGNFHRMYVLVDEDKLFYFSFLIGQKRFENSLVPFSPAWTIPYRDCKYVFMDYHYFLNSTENKLAASPMLPRVNKLIWDGTKYEPFCNSNSLWDQKNHYYFNMFYYSQPNNPEGCACPGCDTYKPKYAQEFKAFHYPNVIVCDYFMDSCI